MNATDSHEVNALVNMFNVSVHVFSRHIQRLQLLTSSTALLGKPRRRRVAVLACGLESASLSFRLAEPEQIAGTLQRLGALMRKVAKKHRGAYVPLGATEFAVVFGLEAEEDTSAFDACSCGLEMLSALDQFNHFQARARQRGLKLSAGVECSDIVVADIAADHGTVPVVVGQALEGGAELRRLARGKPRPILVSEATAKQLTGTILVEAHVDVDEPRKANGRQIQAYEITQMPPHVDYRGFLDELFQVDREQGEDS